MDVQAFSYGKGDITLESGEKYQKNVYFVVCSGEKGTFNVDKLGIYVIIKYKRVFIFL